MRYGEFSSLVEAGRASLRRLLGEGDALLRERFSGFYPGEMEDVLSVVLEHAMVGRLFEDAEVISMGRRWLRAYCLGRRMPFEPFEVVLLSAMEELEPRDGSLSGMRDMWEAESSVEKEAPSEGVFPPCPRGSLCEDLLGKLRAFDKDGAKAMVDGLLERGLPMDRIYQEVFRPVLYRVGDLWLSGTVSVSVEHYSTAMVQYLMAYIYLKRMPFAVRPRARVLVLCAQGEEHELGSRMVADLLEQRGFRSDYLGSSVPIRDVADFLSANDYFAVLISASMVRNVLSALELASLARRRRPRSLVVLGGLAFAYGSLASKVEADLVSFEVDPVLAFLEARLG